jgi:hypothetical protein
VVVGTAVARRHRARTAMVVATAADRRRELVRDVGQQPKYTRTRAAAAGLRLPPLSDVLHGHHQGLPHMCQRQAAQPVRRTRRRRRPCCCCRQEGRPGQVMRRGARSHSCPVDAQNVWLLSGRLATVESSTGMSLIIGQVIFFYATGLLCFSISMGAGWLLLLS